MRASSWAFLIRWVSQRCAFWQEGRQNSFNCSLLSNHVEVNILFICKCLVSFLFSSGFIRLLNSLTYSVITVNNVFSVMKILLFFFVLRYFANGVCLFAYFTCLLFVYFGCAGSVGIFWRAGSYAFSVCDSAVWSAGPVQFYLGFLLERMAGLYGFSFSLALL